MAKASRAGTRKGSSPETIRAEDFRAYLRNNAEIIAPRDVESLVRRREAVVTKMATDCAGRERLARQLKIALHLLDDHVNRKAPQIPFHTVSLLTVALLYFMSPMDAIPDCIEGIGTSDDALVVELAFEAAAAGVERYCIWKGLTTEEVVPPPRPAPSKVQKTSRR